MNTRFEEGCEPSQADTQEDRTVDCMMSIAISLKRIADALHATNEYGEGPAEAIGGNIKRAVQR